ncbi:hypothetical protein Tco_1237455 [Tanacetum coccineum]
MCVKIFYTPSHPSSSDTSGSSSDRFFYSSSNNAHTLSGPLPRRRPKCLDYVTPSPYLSIGSYRKRRRSPANLVSAATCTPAALSPVQDDLLPPHKRLRGLPSAYHYEASIKDNTEIGCEDCMKADSKADVRVNIKDDMDADIETHFDTDILADIEADIATKAVASIEANVEPTIEADVKPAIEADVELTIKVDTEIGAEVDTEVDTKAGDEDSVGDNMDIAVDFVAEPVVPDDLFLSTIRERLDENEDAIQGMYEHLMEIPT